MKTKPGQSPLPMVRLNNPRGENCNRTVDTDLINRALHEATPLPIGENDG